MESVRLFTGIAISPPVLENLENALRKLRPLASLKWSPAENFHVTTKFIGAWQEQRLEELTKALGAIRGFEPFEIAVEGLGFLPNPRNAKVLIAGVRPGAPLIELAAAIEQTLVPLGCLPENRLYAPHLTLARIRKENIGELRKEMTVMSEIGFGTFCASEFHLFLSKPVPGGSVYSRLASFSLGPQA
jgi:2'-5' RNA ligase